MNHCGVGAQLSLLEKGFTHSLNQSPEFLFWYFYIFFIFNVFYFKVNQQIGNCENK